MFNELALSIMNSESLTAVQRAFNYTQASKEHDISYRCSYLCAEIVDESKALLSAANHALHSNIVLRDIAIDKYLTYSITTKQDYIDEVIRINKDKENR